MRILKIVNSIDRGGVFTCEKQFIKELKDTGATVDLVIIGDGESLKNYQSLCDKSFLIPALDASYGGLVFKIAFNIMKTYLYGLKYGKYLAAQIDENAKYDAIIYQRPIFIHLAGILSNKIDAKCLWHLPNVARTSFSRNYYNLFCERYNIVQVANSNFTRSTLGEQCQHVVYPGYDEERVQKSEAYFREKLGIEKDAPVYGVAARMHKDKAQDIVVSAFVNSIVPKSGGHLLVAGGPLDSEFSIEVQKLAKDLLGKQVHFLGEITNLPMFYSSVDVVINGRRNVEPFGISIAEAMGAGKPVMAYKLGGPAEMINHEVNGWLIDTPTVEAYEEAFNLSFTNREQWSEMGRIAKENSGKFSVEESVTELLKIIALQREVAA